MSVRFAITVDFELVQGAREEFLRLVEENAAASMRDEPGCSRFDVLTYRDPAHSDRVFLYEIYEDRAAFDAHVRTAHFAAFDAATRTMVRRKTVLEFDLRNDA